ncbi:MAG: OmpA family protein [Tenacibaculum sp.]|nr:OmpA family protein [Tenacibaculum sp.]
MSVNLLDLVKGQLTDVVVNKAASFLGESTEATQSGLTSAIPTLLGGLMSKAGSQSGITDLLGMVTKPEVTGALGNVSELFGGSESSSNLGGTLLNGILGDKLGGITELITNVAGFKNSDSASGLLKMAAPLLMGVIGKQVGSSGISGLINLLSGQKEHLEKSAPSGLMDKVAGALGVGSFGSLAGNLVNNFAGPSSSDLPSEPKTTSESTEPKKGGNKIFPLILIGAVIAAFFLWKSCGSDVKNATENVKEGVVNAAEGTIDVVKDGANAVGDVAEGTVDAVKDGANAVGNVAEGTANAVKDGANAVGNVAEGTANAVKDGANAVGNVAEGTANAVKDGANAVGGAIVEGADAIYNAGANLVGKTVKGFEHLGEFVSRKLKDGTELIIPNKGFEYSLVDFVEGDKSLDKNAWFNLRRVLFKTGSSSLDERSMSQIDNVAKILKAYPTVELKIGGYTDNTGNANSNKILSAKRAKAVVNALVSKGINKSRLTSEGYGIENPVADNNTEKGRALNRRVAAKVTKK